MNRKTRTILAIVLIEVVLAGIWLYLAYLGADRPHDIAPEFQRTLGSTMGAAMGGFLGLGLLAYFIAAKRDRS